MDKADIAGCGLYLWASGLPNNKSLGRETYHPVTGSAGPPLPSTPFPVVGPLHQVYCMVEGKWEHILCIRTISQGGNKGQGYKCTTRYLSFLPWGISDGAEGVQDVKLVDLPSHERKY